MEPVFEIRDADEGEGGFFARAPGPPILTQGDTRDELRANPVEAVSLNFEDVEPIPGWCSCTTSRTEEPLAAIE